MPLCGSNKSDPPVQKVLIPKGMVNPRETTIIEIPARLHKQPLVIAKRKNSGPANNYTSEPYNKNSNWNKYDETDRTQDNRPQDNRTQDNRAQADQSQRSRGQPDRSYANKKQNRSVNQTNYRSMDQSYDEDYFDFNPTATSSFQEMPIEQSQYNQGNVSASPGYSVNAQARYSARRSNPPPGPGAAGLGLTQINPDFDLDSTEREEKMALQKNLEDFQRARRKLLANATYLANHSHLEN